VKKYEGRERSERIQAAREETRKAQEELDALIERQKAEPAIGVAAGALYAEKRRQARQALLDAKTEEVAEEEASEIEVILSDNGSVVIAPAGFRTRNLKQKGEGDFPFAIMTARFMFKAGYHAEHVIAVTGVGWEEISDLTYDPDGYGNADRLKREADAEKELCDECRGARLH
jgi:hypothetical protein